MSTPIPSPPGLPLIGNLLDVRDEVPLRGVERVTEIYGPIVRLSLGGRHRTFVTSHELFEQLCDETKFCKITAGGLASLQSKGPYGLFPAPHESHPDWQQAHRILMPAFGPLAIQDMFDEMHDIASQLVLKWARLGNEYKIPATSDFTRLTLDTIALCAMDFRFNSFYSDEMHPFVTAMTNSLAAGGKKASMPKLLHGLMWSTNAQQEIDRKMQQETAAKLVKHRRENPTDKKDLLNAMIQGKDPKTGESMRDGLIISNMITFLIAGHETTSGLLSFAFFEMLKNPRTYFAAQQEVDEVLGGDALDVTHLSKLKYINALLRETLRLHPTAPVVSRQMRPESEVDTTILKNGDDMFEVGKDTSIACLLAKIQKDPKIWGEDADEFKPERMVDEEFEKLPKSAWKPFGTGLRACIGRAFAWQEALMVVALLLQNFTLRMDDPSYELRIKQTLTIKPLDFFMRATLRDGLTPSSLQQRLHGGRDVAGEKLKKSTEDAPVPKSSRLMAIYYGSNAGTCQSFAQKVASQASHNGFSATVEDLDAAVGNLPTDRPVIIITASYEGLPPDNAAQFVAWLESGTSKLDGVRFAVFGCGHSDWSSTFQRIPTFVDRLLAERGAIRLTDRSYADAAAGDMFGPFDRWTDESLWPALYQTFGQPEESARDGPGLQLEFSTSRASHLRQDVKEARVLSARRLAIDDDGEKRHIEIQLPEGMHYEAGDYLAILPLNPDESVHRVLTRFSIPADAVVTIKSNTIASLPTDVPISVVELLRGYVELSQPATQKNIRALAGAADHEHTKSMLHFFADEDFEKSITIPRTSILDLLENFPDLHTTFSEFLSMLPPMRTRHYSISSSPLHDDSTCTVTYTVIEAPSTSGHGTFIGVAGSFMRSLKPGDKVHVAVRSTNKYFHLPTDVEKTPIMMFCAGTGIAPFRGFLQERAVQIDAGRKLAPASMFIGCRTSTTDRLYADEIDEWVRQGVVDVRYSFSREPEKSEGCKYVQNRMLRNKEDVGKMWDLGAKVFICGSPALSKGVGQAAREIVKLRAEEAGKYLTEKQIEDWFKSQRNERFVTDVFQ